MRATACMIAWAPPQAPVSFWRRRLGSYHSQPLLGGRKKPKNATRGTATATQLSSKSLTVLFCFRQLRFVVVALSRSSRWQNWACGRQDFLSRHRRGTLCYDLLQSSNRERGCCPGRHSLRFTIYRLGGGCRYCPHSHDGLPRQRWPVRTCHASWTKSSTLNRTLPPSACIYPGIYPYPELL